MTVTRQVPLSVGFFREAYWSGLPFPTSGDWTQVSCISCNGKQILYHWQHLGSSNITVSQTQPQITRFFFEWVVFKNITIQSAFQTQPPAKNNFLLLPFILEPADVPSKCQLVRVYHEAHVFVIYTLQVGKLWQKFCGKNGQNKMWTTETIWIHWSSRIIDEFSSFFI